MVGDILNWLHLTLLICSWIFKHLHNYIQIGQIKSDKKLNEAVKRAEDQVKLAEDIAKIVYDAIKKAEDSVNELILCKILYYLILNQLPLI